MSSEELTLPALGCDVISEDSVGCHCAISGFGVGKNFSLPEVLIGT